MSTLDLKLDPARRWISDHGSYELINDRDAPIERFALTGGEHWKKVQLDARRQTVQTGGPLGPLRLHSAGPAGAGGARPRRIPARGDLSAGDHEERRRQQEFILPSGVVLTSFSPSFAPVVGYMEEIGIKKDENQYEPRVYPDDFYKGKTDAAFGSGHPFTTRIAITGPAAFTFNSVGTRTSDRSHGGQRTVVWRERLPRALLQRRRRPLGGAAGARHGDLLPPRARLQHRRDERRPGRGAPLLLRVVQALPWRELKLSEFPDLASYAQGFPTDISFSEGIGFLTESDVKTDAVFMVTAHESAHQWWGNILTPGKGPGGNLLSEGMAHFSTALLTDQVKGPQARMEFCKRIEESYGNSRRADAERPLVKIDGSRDGDTTVTYDKGGWVFWMMHQQLGRERDLAGLRKFIADWGNGPDYPVLQDFTAAMRPFAPDPAAFDDFVKQWFHQVVVPEYRLSGARKVAMPGANTWKVTARVKNAGTGRMAVEVAAARGDRFLKDKPNPLYHDARQTVTLGAGEERTVEILCAFQPERVLVDPDVKVLQLRRKAAVVKL